MAHVLASELRKAVLQAAFEGRLTVRNENDTPLRILNQTIKENKEKAIKNKTIKKTKQLPKIIEEMEPIEIPERWDYCYIDDIAFVTKLAGFEYSKYIAESVTTSGIPLFKGKNVQNGKLVLNFESYIPESVSDQLNRSQLRKKCLLTPYVGTIGNIAIFDGSFRAHLGSNVGKIEILNDEKEIMLEEYLLYYLRSSYGYNELSKYKKATAQESISIDAIRNVIVPLCSPEEQARIVARVDELMAKIDEYEKLENELVELKKNFPGDMKAAVLQAAMQGKLTEQLESDSNSFILAETIKNERKVLGKNKYVTDSVDELDIPETWTTIKSGECFSLEKGEKVSGVNLPYLEAKYLRGKISATMMSSGEFVSKGTEVILVDGENSGEIFIEPEDGIIGSTFKILFIPKSIDKNYALYFLSMNRDLFRNNKKGAAIPHLSKEIFNDLTMPIPPIEEQKRIVEKLDKILPLCEELEKEIA